jgi:hypothetical protein
MLQGPGPSETETVVTYTIQGPRRERSVSVPQSSVDTFYLDAKKGSNLFMQVGLVGRDLEYKQSYDTLYRYKRHRCKL